jgi:hypothetical protein
MTASVPSGGECEQHEDFWRGGRREGEVPETGGYAAAELAVCKGKPTWFILDEHHGAQLHSLDIRLRFHTAF